MDGAMDDLEKDLHLLKMWKDQSIEIDYSTVWKKAHALANEENPAAMNFFIQGLDDPNWRWRDDCISFLGFHYLLDKKTLEKIRNLLLTDPSSTVRISAASVLGKQSSLPEPALFSAILSDPNHLVRESAFEAILALAGVSLRTINYEIKKIKTREIQPTLSEVRRIVKEENINLPEDVLN